MNEKDIDDVNEGMNEFDDNSYGPCFTINFGLQLYRQLVLKAIIGTAVKIEDGA